MGDVTHEPSMEDILSSIKKIIAEDNSKPQGFTRARPRVQERPVEVEEPVVVAAAPAPEPVALEDDILELTESAPVDMPAESPIVSTVAVEASRHALASLSKLVVKPEVAGSDTLEGVVRDMLKPMLKSWLDANLPEIVERVVAQEVARISGR